MKLIIDIDEDYYKAIWENGYIYDEDNEDIAKIIKDGTPLEEELKKIKSEIKDEEDSTNWLVSANFEKGWNEAVEYAIGKIDNYIEKLKGKQE